MSEIDTHTNVFVYGTLKSGFGNHAYYLQHRPGVSFVGYGTTKERFRMLDGGFPVVVKHELDAPFARVQGEVYSVPLDLVSTSLDSLEGYPEMYDRDEIEIELQDGSVQLCWMYHGTERYWPDTTRREPVTPNSLGYLSWPTNRNA